MNAFIKVNSIENVYERRVYFTMLFNGWEVRKGNKYARALEVDVTVLSS